jgi:hypothetical protein
VPFGSFAINNADGTCDLYIQNLNVDNNMSNVGVLGAMFLQNFVALFT